MKLYTLTYDCNTPTKQQINVPTNTDYKLGIKVRRNGEIQKLSPESVKLGTGETYTIEPTNLSVGQSSSLTGDSSAVNVAGNNTSDIAGQVVDARNVFVEVTYDDGATWSKFTPLAGNVKVNDRSAGTNNYIAFTQLNNPNRKWELYNAGVPTGETSQTLTMPSVVYFVILGPQAGSWGFAQYPAKLRLNVGVGGGTFEKYIEPDAEKLNGYVTFTLSADDNASYTSEKLDIQKGYDFSDTIWNSGGPAVSGDRANFLSAESSAEQLGLAGLEMTVDDIQWGYNNAGTAQLTPADITEWLNAKNYYGAVKSFFNWPNGQSALAFQAANPNALAWFSEDGTQAEWKEKVTIDPRWILVTGGTGTGYKTQAGKYWVVAYKFKLGTPWSANFTLNTNIFKSQQGDIADSVESASTAKLAGKFADGTDFEYDIVAV